MLKTAAIFLVDRDSVLNPQWAPFQKQVPNDHAYLGI